MVAYFMSDIGTVHRELREAPWSDRWVMIVTFALTVLSDLVVAVNVGIIFSMLLFVRNMHRAVRIEKIQLAVPIEGVTVLMLEGPFFFGATEKLEHALFLQKKSSAYDRS